MVAIIAGKGVGLERSSALVLGSQGQLGSASLGRGGDNVYVNAANGNLVISRQDEFLLGLGPDVSIDRTYNSQGDLSDDNGDNWRMGVYRKVTGLSGTYGAGGTTVKRIDWDGSDTLYTWKASESAYIATAGAGAYDKLTKTGTVWTWTDGNTQVAETYDNNNGGRITATTDTAGNALTYTYNGSGLITRVTSSNGPFTDEYTDLVYSGTLLTQVATQTASGQRTRVFYEYDEYNRLAKVKVNLNPADNSKTTGANYETTYAYSGTSKRVTSITQSDGSVLTIGYTQSGSVYRVTTLTQTIATGVSRVTNIGYNGIGTYATVSDDGLWSTFLIDANQNVVSLSLPGDQYSQGTTHQFEYNANGDVISGRLAGSRGVKYEYDSRGNLITECDDLGNTIKRTFSSKNELLTETRYAIPDKDKLGSASSPGTPMTTRFAYDARGNLRFVLGAGGNADSGVPVGNVTEYRYDDYNRRTAVIQYLANGVSMGNPVSGNWAPTQTVSLATMEAFVAAIGDKSTARRTETDYDFRGNVSAEKSYSKLLSTGLFDTSSELSQTTYVYDQAGNLLSKLINGSSATETFIYDGLNRIISSTDFNNVATSIAFNDASQTTVVTRANGLIQTSLYNKAGGLITYTESGGGSPSVSTNYRYDALGWLRNVTDALGKRIHYMYDSAGRKLADIDADGSVVEYRHDASGNVTSTTRYANKLSAGQLAALTGANGSPINVSYDSIRPGAHADDRWTWHIYDAANRLARTIDGTGATTLYSYDGASRLVSTRQYANRTSASDIAMLKADPASIHYVDLNIAYDPNNAYVWHTESMYVSGDNPIDGFPAFRFVANTWYDPALIDWSPPVYVDGPYTVTVEFTVLGTKNYENSHQFGFFNPEEPDDWSGASTATILSGPGMLGFWDDIWHVSQISKTAPTRIRVVRQLEEGQAAQFRFFIRYRDPESDPDNGVLNEGVILSNPFVSVTNTVPPALPVEDAADRVARTFHDRDGRLIGSLDAEGYLSQVTYDKAGQKMKSVAYAGATAASLRASGTFAQLLASITVDNAKDIHSYCVYDSRGLLRAEIDGEGALTRYAYTPIGEVSEIVTGQKLDPADLLTTPPTFATLPDAPSGTTLETIVYERNHYGQVQTETKSMTDSTSTVTAYAYDNMRRLISTTTQSGGADARMETRRYDARGNLKATLSGIGSALLASLGPNPDEELADPIWAEYGTSFGYDAADRLIALADANGARTLFYYDADDRLAYEIDAVGQIVEYRYNALGDRTDAIVHALAVDSETLAEMVGGKASDVAGIITALANSALDQASHVEFNVDGTIKQSTDPLGELTTFTYNAFGELVLRSDPFSTGTIIKTSLTYDRRGLLKTEIIDSAAGGKAITTTYGYDAFGRAVQLTDPHNHVTATAFDRAGRIKSTTDALAGVSSFTYDARGNLVAVEDALGQVSRFVYDHADRRIFAIDALGGVVATGYDGDDRVLSTRAYANAISLNGLGYEIAAADVTVQLIADAGDRITRHAYDKDGRLRFTVDGAAGLTEYRHDDVGNAIRTIRHGWTVSPASTYTMDDLQAEVDAHESDPRRVSRAVYDRAGRMTFAIDPVGNVTAFSYDSAGRITRQVAFVAAYDLGDDPLDDVMQGWAAAEAHADDRVSRAVYDRKGRLVYSIDAENFVTEYRYNKRDSLVKEIRYADPYAVAEGATPASLAAQIGSLPASAIVTNFVYDSAGRLAETVDGLGIRTVMTLDQRGQTLSSTLAYGTSHAVTTSFEYDALGRIESETRAVGTAEEQITTYVYDVLGELVSTSRAVGTTAEWTTTRSYDALGRLKREMSGIGSALLASLGPNPDPELADPIWAQYAIQFGYDTAGRMVVRSDARGARTLFYYDTADRLAYEVDALGDVVEYRYNAIGDRTDAIRYAARIDSETLWEMLGGDASDVAGTVAALADASLDGKTVATYDAAGRLSLSSGPLGSYTAYGYNSFGEVQLRKVALGESGTPGIATEIETSFVYDRRGKVETRIVDSAAGGKAITTSYGYDAFGREIMLTDANNHITDTVHDRAGRVVSTTDALNNTTVYTYDARGNLVAVTDAANKITRHVYDKANRRIATIDALGGVTTTTYDGDGRAVATRAYYTTVSTGSLPLEVTQSALSLPGTHAADHVTRYSYDKDGQLRFLIDGLMHVVEYVYDVAGNAVRTIAYDGTIATDGTGAYSASWLADQVAGLAGAAGTRTARSVYDAVNRLAYAIDAIGQVTWVSYDAKGQVIKQVEIAAPYETDDDPSVDAMDTWRAGIANPTSDRTTRAYYDRKGRLNYSIDALGHVTRYEYDRLGNVKKQSRYADVYPASDATTLANLDSNFASPPGTVRATLFNYDSAGRLEETIDPEGYSTKLVLDALGQISESTAAYGLSTASVTTYSYDDVGRLKTETRGHGAAEVSVTAFDYDALGRMTQSTAGYGTADASITKWEYDELGRVKKQIRGHGTSEVADTQNFYDAFGRLTSNVDARGSVVSRTYTVLDQLQSETKELEAGTADDRETGYTYDSLGNVVKVRDARGNDSFAYYDKLGRVLRQVDGEKYVTDTTYTRGNQVWTIKRWANASTATIVETTVPADPVVDGARDATTTFSYNKRDELTDVQDAMGHSEGYTLNAFGERIQIRNKLHGSVVNGVTLDTNVYYTFDKRGLMKTETLPVTTKTAGGATVSVINSYDYDARGNRTKMVEAEGAAEARTTNYVHDKLDRLIQTTHDAVTIVNDDLTSTANYTPSETIKYDRRGNVIEMVDAGGARTLSWYDDLDRAIWRVSQTEKVGGVEKGTLSRTTYDGNGNATAVQVYGDLVVLPASGGAVPSPGDAGNYRLTSFTHYRDDRVKEKILTALTTGEWNGSGYVVTPGLISGATNPAAEIRTLVEYDKAGNVTHQEDGRGNDIWTWYDKLGRKTAEVDAENYLTVWTRDAEGNASSETRHATRLSSFDPASPTPPTVAATAADRTTGFLYDRNGRRTQEERLAVAYTAIDTVGAWTDVAATDASAKSTITYTYNGLGEVLTRSEAAGATTNTYDTIGRLTLETGQSFTDYQGATVTPRTAYSYDGLNNLISTRAQMGAAANDTNDRITSNTYGAGGRLLAMTDAANFTHTYGYDAAGRMVRDSYARVRSNGSSITEAQVTRYDIAGRAITQTSARLSGSTWLFTDEAGAAYDAVRMRYNAFGEMSGRGVTAGPNAAEAYHESFEYDRGGRLWKTTQGDGVLRFHVYDRSGNQTLTLASAGASLSGLTLDTYAGSINGYGGTSAGAVTTIGVFDKRGQQIRTRDPDRQLSASATQLIVHGRTYNAFGEVASETDARGFDASGNAITFTGGAGYTTMFSYNAMGRLISKVSPQVSVTDEHGGVSNVNPTELYGYDLSGRLVSVIDANNHRTTRLLLAGTGLGDSEASTLKEFTPHPSVFERKYDVFGAQRVTVDELGKTETFLYDKMNRLVRQDHPLRPAGSLGNTTGADIQLIDEYGYDGLGRRTQHWNSQYGPTVQETTDYDAQGRVEKVTDFGGDSTITTYAWSTTIAASGLGAVGGGWAKTTYNPGGTSQREDLDYFGRTVDRVDAGLNDYDLTFDYGGRLTGQSIVGVTSTSMTWFNTGLVATQSADGITAAYGYDGDGRRTLESYGAFQNATVTWDALGRMKTYDDTGAVGGTAPAEIDYEYDAVGNVRRMSAHYSNMDSQGVIFGSGYPQEYWYEYDSMNRFTTTKGVFTGTPGSGAIVGGTQISYDAAGNRATATMTTLRTKRLHKYVPSLGPPTPRYYDDDANVIYPDDGGGTWSDVDFPFYSGQVETYSYTADGYLAGVSVATQELLPTGDFGKTNPQVGTLGPSVARGGYEVDAMGRVTRHSEYDPTGTEVYSRAATYNSKSQLTRDVVTSLVANATTGGTDTIEAATDYYYTTLGGAYLGGAIDRQITTNKKGGTLEATVTITNSYDLWESRRQASSTEATDYVTGTDTNYGSYYSYDGLGHLSSVSIGGGRARTVTFVTDIDGRVLQRDEEDGLGTGDPRDLHYYFNGVQLGGVSNNGTSDVDYVTGIARHTAAAGTGPFAGGAANATNHVDFDQSYDPINGITASSTGSRYTTVQGDTLQSVALAVWGDSSLWYLIARVNGLMGNENLAAGITLSIPNKVTNFRNAADTFKVYDPNEALGDLSPTAPKPPKAAKKGCGMIGTILVALVAVAVAIALPELSPFFAKGIGLVLAGAISSAVSQGVGIATGVQQKFSWKGVALSALSAGVGLGLGKLPGGVGAFMKADTFVSNVVRGAASSAISQGVGVATGLQSSFSWAGVAAAGVAAGVSGAIGRALSRTETLPGVPGPDGAAGAETTVRIPTLAGRVVGGAAGSIAAATARSIVTGTSFGDNILAVLPDIIANTLGAVASDAIAAGRARAARDIALSQNQIIDKARNALLTEGALTDDQRSRLPNLPGANIRVGENPLFMQDGTTRVNALFNGQDVVVDPGLWAAAQRDPEAAAVLFGAVLEEQSAALAQAIGYEFRLEGRALDTGAIFGGAALFSTIETMRSERVNGLSFTVNGQSFSTRYNELVHTLDYGFTADRIVANLHDGNVSYEAPFSRSTTLPPWEIIRTRPPSPGIAARGRWAGRAAGAAGGVIVGNAIVSEGVDAFRGRQLAVLSYFEMDPNNARNQKAAEAYIMTYDRHTSTHQRNDVFAAEAVMWFARQNPAGWDNYFRRSEPQATAIVEAITRDAVARRDNSRAISPVSPGLASYSTRARTILIAAGQTRRLQNWQAHHLIPVREVFRLPWNVQVYMVRQGWRTDSLENLIAVPADRETYLSPPNSTYLPFHRGPHPNYSRDVQVRLTVLNPRQNMRPTLLGIENTMRSRLVDKTARYHQRIN
jgi:YD repeat-containing protein